MTKSSWLHNFEALCLATSSLDDFDPNDQNETDAFIDRVRALLPEVPCTWPTEANVRMWGE